MSEPASFEHGANTSSSIDLSPLAYSLQHSDMSAYTESRGDRENTSPSYGWSLRSNQM